MPLRGQEWLVILEPFKKPELVATVWEEDEDEEFKEVSAEESDSEDPWNITGDGQADKELSEAGLVGPWVAKGNPPGFLDSEDEADLEEAAWYELKRRKDYYTSPGQWREIGEFLLHQTGYLVGVKYPGDEIYLMDEMLGEFDGEEEDRGKNNISEQLRAVQDNANRVHELEDEVEELKERLERERKRNKDLATTKVGLMEDRRNTIAEDRFEGLANYLAGAIGFSRGRLVETLIGAVKDHLEKLESRAKEDPIIKKPQSETKRKSERLGKVDDKKERDEVIFFLRRELRQMKEALTLAIQSVEKTESVDIGVQALPIMENATTEPMEEALVDAMERKKQKQKKGKGRAIERSPLKTVKEVERKEAEGDAEMKEADRYVLPV